MKIKELAELFRDEQFLKTHGEEKVVANNDDDIYTVFDAYYDEDENQLVIEL
jgi:hypothetical protein